LARFHFLQGFTCLMPENALFCGIMNHLNCFVLESIAKSLQEKIAGKWVIDCFSNSMDDLCLEFEDLTMRCIFYEGTMYFQFEENGPGKNRLFKPQFSDLKSLTVNTVIVHPFERSFHIEIGADFKLVFKCHGRKSNVILFEGIENSEIFRKHLEKDADMSMQDIFRTVNPEFRMESFTSQAAFEHAYPYLPPEVYGRMQAPYSEQQFTDIINTFRQIKGFHITDELDLQAVFNKDNTVLHDISRYSGMWLRHIVFKTSKEKLLLRYEQSIREKQNFIASNLQALADIEARRSDEEIGNIILSNLHLIRENDKLVTLHDIYNDSSIDVRLDEKLNAVENAQKYFKKEKNKPLMVQLLQQKIDKAEKVLTEHRQKLEELQKAQHYKSLKPLVNEAQKKQEETDLPYRKFSFENFEILVGKHAESNEKILNYYSDKDDVWLHAKDVSGSHVLVKMKKKEKIPEKVLEKAASLAAYYSKNRNQDLVTVAYTLRKYVRKIKGADKGKVTVSNEKAILVKPGK
jgi:predicted ribosome quality control (RQC) complex YloA/Tae2 family protein